MDFFAHQDRARRKTGRLVIFFLLAIVGIIVSTYLVIALTLLVLQQSVDAPDLWRLAVDPRLILGVTVAITLLVGGGTVYKLAELRGGGRVVAESVGGRLLYPGTTDPVEQRVLNVVEEMAIAAGTTVPPVYFMDQEQGINAFAAGYEPGDAVIGVTRGTAEQLSRDELQGVIAHEFSHILNGDMRLNIRLIGLLHGILVIGMVGYFILRSSFYLGGGSRRSRGGGVAAILAMGAGLAVIGFVGTLFGNLIKAAVSRQREFLADASAVQFTRNPSGIAGALQKIGGAIKGSRIHHPNAPQASHMFFGRAITSGLSGLFSTHPPLPQRIRRIEPDWDGTFTRPAPAPSALDAAPPRSVEREQRAALARAAAIAAAAGSSVIADERTYENAVARIGSLTEEHIAYAQRLIDGLPPDIRSAVHETYGAQAVVAGLLLSRDEEVRSRQLDLVERTADRGLDDETRRLVSRIEAVPDEARLPLVDLAIPTLRNLSPPQYHRFRSLIGELVRADGRIDLFEWVLHHILVRHLDPAFDRVRPTPVQYYALHRLEGECELTLSMLAWLGTSVEEEARAAFASGASQLGLTGLRLRPADESRLDELAPALDQLAMIASPLKKRLIIACATTIHHDRAITVREGELLRAICDQLDCPMPPLLPGQPVE